VKGRWDSNARDSPELIECADTRGRLLPSPERARLAVGAAGAGVRALGQVVLDEVREDDAGTVELRAIDRSIKKFNSNMSENGTHGETLRSLDGGNHCSAMSKKGQTRRGKVDAR
jgi:hypothetical protein